MLKPLLIAAILFTGTLAKGQEKNFIDMPYLEVTGNADSLVMPDEIYISIYISEKSSKDRVPLEDQEAKMYNSFRALGINTEQDLFVKDMASNFRSYFLKGADVVKSRRYVVKVGTAQMAGKVFIELEKLDIANSNIESVNHSGMESIRNRIRSKAMRNAKERATALTQPLGQSVGMAIYINDNVGVVKTMVGANHELQGIAFKKRAEGNSSSDKDLTDIEFQKIRVAEEVAVRFALK